MKNIARTLIYVVVVALLSTPAFAQVEVPNTFVPGQPARANEVNANFSTIVAAANQNSSDISTNSTNITSNSDGISSNSQSLTNLSANVSTISQAVEDLTPPPGFAFAGFSSNTVKGDAGIFGMNAACQADFGSDSRMASSLEILHSTVQPSMTAATAWVKPAVIAAIPRPDSKYKNTLFEASGVASVSGSLSCDGWREDYANGLAITAAGGFLEQKCKTLSAVACSVVQE